MASFIYPLCGFPLKHGAKGVAIFDLVVALSFFSFQLYNYDSALFSSDVEDVVSRVNLTKFGNETRQEQIQEIDMNLATGHYDYVFIGVTAAGTLMLLVDIWLSVKLWRASNSGDAQALLMWIGVRAVYIGATIFSCVILVSQSSSEFLTETIVNWLSLVACVGQMFGIVIVNELRREILATGHAQRV